jgi:hypothetical protein
MNKKGEICEYWQPAEETLPIEKREAIQGLGLRILDLRGEIY